MDRRQKSTVLWILLGLTGAGMAAGAISLLMPRRFIDDRVFATIFVVGVYALAAMVIVSLGTRMRSTLRLASVGLGASLVIYLTAIWVERTLPSFWENLVWKSGFVAMVVGLVFTHRLLIVPLLPVATAGRIAKPVALWSALFFAGLCIFGVVFEDVLRFDGWFPRLLGLGGITTAGSSIAVAAVAILGPTPGEDEPGLLTGSVEVPINCPRCGTHVAALSNRDTRCPSCRLKIRVEIEEPRCACGYLLYQLEGDTCPECGRAIDDAERWSASAV